MGRSEGSNLGDKGLFWRTLSGFFIYSFLSQHRSMVGTRLNPSTAYQRLDRGGVDFPPETTALITW